MIDKKEKIIKYFESGSKDKKKFKIGIEHEKFLFNNNNNKSINLIGWILFIISALGFIISSIGSFWAMFGSLFFLIACIVFLIPFFRKDESEK